MKVVPFVKPWNPISMGQAQLYKYNTEFFSVNKEESHYFSQQFVESEIDKDYVSWLNFHGLEDRSDIENLCRKLQIDKLSVENIYQSLRRPKVEEYGKYMFFSVKSALPCDLPGSKLNQEQITFILGEHYLISFQEKSSDHFTEVRDRIQNNRGKIRSKRSDFLLFRMLEAIIDNYFEVLEDISDNIDDIDRRLHIAENKAIFHEIEEEKRKLIELRKIAQPMRDITNQLEHSESSFLDKSNFHYFSHLRSSCVSVLEEIDANKQILEGMANLFYAAQGQRMNEIMRVLTVVSSIFIPLTFIVGVYGMNFKYMPELQYPYGYYTVVGVLFFIGLAMLLFFIKRGWLRKNREE